MNKHAELIESIHQPWKATLAECLQRWRGLDPLKRAQSYLVIQEMTGIRRRLNATKIAALAFDAGQGMAAPPVNRSLEPELSFLRQLSP